MFCILLHSSKTMRLGVPSAVTKPRFLEEARTLAKYIAAQSPATLSRVMGVSEKLAVETNERMTAWSDDYGTAAIDTFIGDIYSGLQAGSLSEDDRAYAQKSLLILSGLYGVLRPLDGVRPYRLEMAYRFPDAPYDNLYSYWGARLADALPAGRTIINTSSVEYTKAVFPHISDARIMTPKFLSINPKTDEPTFVTVHAKIARGAFARWVIENKIEDEARLREFVGLGYVYDAAMSTELEPVYVAERFSGQGLSVRLS